MNIAKAITESGLAKSFAEARRYILMKAVKVNGVVIDDLTVEVKSGEEIRIGRTSRLATASASNADERNCLGDSTSPPSS
jgi:ribosomal protein S4